MSSKIATTILGTLLIASTALASHVRLDAAPAQAWLSAEQPTTTYVRVSLEGLVPHQARRTEANVALVLDRSGSMAGLKLDRAKQAAILAIERLSPSDIVSVIVYDTTVDVLVPATRLTDKQAVIRRIRSLEPGDNTALFAGVAKGAAELRKFARFDRPNRLVLLSDGLANVGPSSPSELGELGASLIREGITVTTLGLGDGYNEDLMTQLAYRSDGNHAFIEEPQDLAKVFGYELDGIIGSVATGLEIRISCGPGVRPVRVLNADARISGRVVEISLNQLAQGQQRYVLLEIEVQPGRSDSRQRLADVVVDYADVETGERERLFTAVNASFTVSKETIFNSTDLEVMAACITQKANVVNKQAVDLRDQGKIAEARELLVLNAKNLAEEAAEYEASGLDELSKELKRLEAYNLDDSEKLDSSSWNKQRKIMRGNQIATEKQQLYSNEVVIEDPEVDDEAEKQQSQKSD